MSTGQARAALTIHAEAGKPPTQMTVWATGQFDRDEPAPGMVELEIEHGAVGLILSMSCAEAAALSEMIGAAAFKSAGLAGKPNPAWPHFPASNGRDGSPMETAAEDMAAAAERMEAGQAERDGTQAAIADALGVLALLKWCKADPMYAPASAGSLVQRITKRAAK